MTELTRRAALRIAKLVGQIFPQYSHREPVAVAAAAEDEPDRYIEAAEEDRKREEYKNAGTDKLSFAKTEPFKPFFPHLIVPTFVEEAVKSVRCCNSFCRMDFSINYRVMLFCNGGANVLP